MATFPRRRNGFYHANGESRHDGPRRAAIYARVSTSDKDQNPETQLLPLREFAQAQGWQVTGEFVDTAGATDLRGRVAWRELLDLASRRRVDMILCWKLDRCFRSTLHAAEALEKLRRWGVGLRSYTEPWADSTNAACELMFTIATAFAAFERALIRERVRSGMDRARKEGTHVGRPRDYYPSRKHQRNQTWWDVAHPLRGMVRAKDLGC
jgi:DNA invertase Pin-like site-specific DNA recombinase